MGGRYASTARRTDLLEQFQVDDDKADELKGPDYNVAPTKLAPVVISRPPASGPKDADAVRQLRLFKWGLYRTVAVSAVQVSPEWKHPLVVRRTLSRGGGRSVVRLQ